MKKEHLTNLKTILTYILPLILFFTCENKRNNIEIRQVNEDVILKKDLTNNETLLSKEDTLIVNSSNEYIKYIINYNDNKLGLYYDLTYDEYFMKIMNNSNDFLDNAISLLKLNKLSNIKKEVVILSMATLTIENRIKFIVACSHLYKRKILDRHQLAGAFDHYFGDKKIFFEYQDKRVVFLMKEIISDNELPESIKRLSKKILNGKMKERFLIDKQYLSNRNPLH